jgi:hypothetical protein
MTATHLAADYPPDDPVFLHSRREFFLIVGIWGVFLLWVVSYCYNAGYQPVTDASQLELVLGIPSWVFWGVAVPWLVADVVTVAMCLWVIKDDDLAAPGWETEPDRDR